LESPSLLEPVLSVGIKRRINSQKLVDIAQYPVWALF
jgi:hypothetical protein